MRGLVSVYRGPLLYGLKIGEDWRQTGVSCPMPIGRCFPTTPWNYGLVIDSAHPLQGFRVGPVNSPGSVPFDPAQVPVTITAPARAHSRLGFGG